MQIKQLTYADKLEYDGLIEYTPNRIDFCMVFVTCAAIVEVSYN